MMMMIKSVPRPMYIASPFQLSLMTVRLVTDRLS
jgi:hypothetical protein